MSSAEPSQTGPTGELSQAQERLGAALDKARGGEDREVAAQVREGGERLCRQLFGLLRMTRTHSLDNQAFDRPAAELEGTLQLLHQLLGAVHVVAVEEQVYVNDVRVRLDERNELGRQLAEELKRHLVGGMSFHQVPAEARIRRLIELFASPAATDGHPRLALQARLNAEGIDMVELVGIYRFRVAGEKARGVVSAADIGKVGQRAVGAVDAAMDSMAAARMPNPLPVRRVITELLEAGKGAMALWDEESAANAFHNHCLRVALLASLIGRDIGLSPEALQDLGVAAMFHDIGYAAREGAIAATASDPGHPGYAPPFERHASAGARMLLRQRGFHEAKIRRALAALEHHRPLLHERGRPTLFGRILCIAEAYDNLTRRGAGQLCPTVALSAMSAQAGTVYDPVLLQVLINALGRYPPGTLLELADGRLLKVASPARSPALWERPLCEVILDEQGLPPMEPEQWDLAYGGEVARVVTER